MKAGKSEGPKNDGAELNEKLEEPTAKSCETAGRDNCGHEPGLAKRRPSAGGTISVVSDMAKEAFRATHQRKQCTRS